MLDLMRLIAAAISGPGLDRFNSPCSTNCSNSDCRFERKSLTISRMTLQGAKSFSIAITTAPTSSGFLPASRSSVERVSTFLKFRVPIEDGMSLLSPSSMPSAQSSSSKSLTNVCVEPGVSKRDWKPTAIK